MLCEHPTKDTRTPAIAGRKWHTGTLFYVVSVPGDGGADWGYTTNIKQAKRLKQYWKRRFAADCARVGAAA